MSAGSLASHETLPGDLANFLNEVKIEHALTARGRLIFRAWTPPEAGAGHGTPRRA